MKWFEGSIPDAIQAAKANGSVFIVYISGDDELSKMMGEVWQDTAVCALCEKERCVGLSLDSNSESCTQFGQIYPVVCMPCTFFIGNNGVPLEVVGGHLEPRDFYKKIQNATQMHKAMLAPQTPPEDASAVPSHVPMTPSPQPPPPITSEPLPVTTPTDAQPTPAIHEEDVEGTVVGGEGVSASTSEQLVESLEERMEKARNVIEEKRRLKAEKKREEQKEKERQRRQLGADLHKFKKAKCEMEAEELKQARIKERQEEKAARERVRKQIAEDKADRIARNQEREVGYQPAAAAAAAAAPATAAPPAVDPTRMQTTRLQFRLPDGSAVTNQFPSSNRLADARDFIQPHVVSLGAFNLSTTYPKRIFTDADMAESLLDLRLAPSAVLVILPSTKRVSPLRSVAGHGSSNFLMIILAPFMAIWGFICSFLFGQPQNPGGAYNPQQEGAAEGGAQQQQSGSATLGSNGPSTSTGRGRRPKSSYGLRRRQEGNIHRLSADDSDEDLATYNGNSTQQM